MKNQLGRAMGVQMQGLLQPVRRVLLVGTLLTVTAGAVGSVLFSARVADAQAPAESGDAQQIQVGDTVITAEQLEYDGQERRYVLSGGEQVVLVSRDSRLVSRKMTVQMNEANELEWARCEGQVFVEKKDPETGEHLTARGQHLEYFEKERKANLSGGVTVQQASARLAEPMVVTGERVELDLAKQFHVVHRGSSAPAKATVKPKGSANKPGVPTELTADKIEVNHRTQEYVASGKPVLIQPDTRLEAERLQFNVDEKVNDVRSAQADGNVVYRGKSDNGSTLYASADKGVYNKELAPFQLIMTGSARGEVKEPGKERPTKFEANRFEYNTNTGRWRMSGNSRVILPELPKNQSANPGANSGEKK